MVVVIVRVVCFFIGVGGGKFKGIELKGREDRVDQLCWDPKHADLIATASGNKTVRMWPVWDVCSGKCSHQAELRGENINITYKPDGTHIAVCNRLKIKNCEKLQYLVDQREDTYTSSSSSSAMHMENINSSSVALLEKLSISPCPSLTCIFLKVFDYKKIVDEAGCLICEKMDIITCPSRQEVRKDVMKGEMMKLWFSSGIHISPV
ncbi:hypothetical protein ACOSP7_030023 [Xanthoceras sorbifolium]